MVYINHHYWYNSFTLGDTTSLYASPSFIPWRTMLMVGHHSKGSIGPSSLHINCSPVQNSGGIDLSWNTYKRDNNIECEGVDLSHFWKTTGSFIYLYLVWWIKKSFKHKNNINSTTHIHPTHPLHLTNTSSRYDNVSWNRLLRWYTPNQ